MPTFRSLIPSGKRRSSWHLAELGSYTTPTPIRLSIQNRKREKLYSVFRGRVNDYSIVGIIFVLSHSCHTMVIINDRSVSRSGIDAELLVKGFGLSGIEFCLAVQILKIIEGCMVEMVHFLRTSLRLFWKYSKRKVQGW
jgi:hypothetical protein